MKRFVAIALLLFGSFSLFAQQWEIDLQSPMEKLLLRDGIKDSDGNAVMVGAIGESNLYFPMVVKISPQGEMEQQIFEEQFENLVLDALVQLPNGNYFATGYYYDTVSYYGYCQRFGSLVIDSKLRVVASHIYEPDSTDMEMQTGDLLLDDDGTIVYTGGHVYSEDGKLIRIPPFFYRFDANGDVLDRRYVYAEDLEGEGRLNDFRSYQIMKNPSEDGYVISGNGPLGGVSLIFYDSDFQFVRSFRMQDGNAILLDEGPWCDYWYSENELLIYGGSWIGNIVAPLLARINLDGTVVEYQYPFLRADTIQQVALTHSMVYVNDSTIYGVERFYENMAAPIYTNLFLFDTEMEVLGNHIFKENEYCNMAPKFLISQEDGGCIVEMDNYLTGCGKLVKMSREDFNPIPCGVSKIPKEQLEALAFPNPASDEIHFDISELPVGKEHRISISDAMGRLVMSRIIRGEGNVLTVGIADFKPGIYTYQIYNAEKEIVSGKFVKE